MKHCSILDRAVNGISRLNWMLLCSILLLTGCGFRPRGSTTQLTDPGVIYIDSSRGITLATELEKALADRAFTIAENRDQAEILLRLTDETQIQRIVSVKSTGRVSEFELNHSVNMLIAHSAEVRPPVYDPDKSPNRVEVIREYTNDERGVLGKEDEARILRQEMRAELIRQIVLRTVAGLASSVSSLSGELSE